MISLNASARWSGLISQLEGSPPNSGGQWPSMIGVQTVTGAAGAKVNIVAATVDRRDSKKKATRSERRRRQQSDTPSC